MGYREENIELAAYQILQNSSFAIDYFFSILDDQEFIKNQGLFFLSYYGFLQALVNQQNSVMFLYKSVTGKKLRLPPKIKKIRKIRNQSVGHPSNFNTTKGEKFAYMTETYITQDKEFCYMVLGDDDEHEGLIYFKPIDLAAENKKFVEQILLKLKILGYHWEV